MQQIISMILRRLMNKGINTGIRAATNRGKGTSGGGNQQGQPTRNAQLNKRGLRTASRMLRRMGKF